MSCNQSPLEAEGEPFVQGFLQGSRRIEQTLQGHVLHVIFLSYKRVDVHDCSCNENVLCETRTFDERIQMFAHI